MFGGSISGKLVYFKYVYTINTSNCPYLSIDIVLREGVNHRIFGGGDGISCKHGLQLDCNPGAPACVFYTVITDRSPPKRFGVLLHRKTPI